MQQQDEGFNAIVVFPQHQTVGPGGVTVEIFGWIVFRDNPPTEDDCVLFARLYGEPVETSVLGTTKLVFARHAHLKSAECLSRELTRLQTIVRQCYGFDLRRIRYTPYH